MQSLFGPTLLCQTIDAQGYSLMIGSDNSDKSTSEKKKKKSTSEKQLKLYKLSFILKPEH